MLKAGIKAIEGLHIVAEPDLGILAYGADALDMHAVVQSMREAGWFVAQTEQSQGLHLMLTPAYAPMIERYLSDLATAVAQTQQGPARAIDADTRGA